MSDDTAVLHTAAGALAGGPGPVLILIVAAFSGAVLSSVVGFGGGLILLPALLFVLGAKVGIPVLALAQWLGGLGRVGVNWRALHWRIAAWFALGAVPGGIAGSLLLVEVPTDWLERGLGAFLLAYVAYRHLLHKAAPRLTGPGMATLGAAIGLLAGLGGIMGPAMAPFFLGAGLAGAAYVGTLTLAALVMQLSRVVTYLGVGLFDVHSGLLGALLGLVSIAGAVVGYWIVGRVPQKLFARLVEGVLLVAGLYFLFRPA